MRNWLPGLNHVPSTIGHRIGGRPRRQSGAALMIVLIVLGTLLVVATPFLISMLLHKQTSDAYQDHTVAIFSALGAKNHAIPSLMKSHPYLELRLEDDPEAAPWNNPDCDSPAEWSVPWWVRLKRKSGAEMEGEFIRKKDGRYELRLDTGQVVGVSDKEVEEVFFELAPGIPISAPDGEIWGIRVQDEQGKLNMATAPPHILDNLFRVLKYLETGEATADSKLVKGLEDVFTAIRRSKPAPEDEVLDDFEQLLEFMDSETALGVSDPVGLLAEVSRHLQTAKVKASERKMGEMIDALKLAHQFFSVVDMKPFLTTVSSRPVVYRYAQRLRWVDATGKFNVENKRPLGLGARLRFSRGVTLGEACVVEDKRGEGFRVDDGVTLSQDDFNDTVELVARHPVNANTASKEVLMAVVYNLRLAAAQGKDRVTLAEAEALADKFIERNEPLANEKEVLEFLGDMVNDSVISTYDGGAILENAMLSTSRRLNDSRDNPTRNFGTVPFCLASYDAYLIEATAAVNDVSGNQVTQCTIREVVEITPPGSIAWPFERELDFDRAFHFGNGNSDILTTWPQVMKEVIFSDRSRGVENGDIRLRAQQDERGDNLGKADHFDQEHEGQEISGSPISYDLADDTIPPPPASGFDLKAGGLEMWVRLSNADSEKYFMDVGQKPTENRLAFYHDGSYLTLKMWDATVDTFHADVRMPVAFDGDTWYHVGGYWKSTDYGLGAVLVDGFPFGTDGSTLKPSQFTYRDASDVVWGVGLLDDDISDSDTDIDVNALPDVTDPVEFLHPELVAAGLTPPQGFPVTVVRIGAEAIEVEDASSGSLSDCRRGARGTAAVAHPENAPVTAWGYADPLDLKEDMPLEYFVDLEGNTMTLSFLGIPKVDAEVREAFGTPEDTLVYVHNPPRRPGDPDGITSTDMIIPVRSTPGYDVQNPPAPDEIDVDMTNFPEQGMLVLGGALRELGMSMVVGPEVVVYSSKTDNPDAFVGCVRGVLGTATAFPDGTPLTLFALPVSNIDDYPQPGFVQLEDEWIFAYPEEDDINSAPWLFGFGIAAEYAQDFGLDEAFASPLRGVPNRPPVLRTLHSPDEKVIPVFAVQRPSAGSSDLVTIVRQDQTLDKEVNIIRHALIKRELEEYIEEQGIIPGYLLLFLLSLDFNTLVGFWEFTQEAYPADGVTRLMKFPSGELASYLEGPISVAGPSELAVPAYGGLAGHIDEIKFFNGPRGDYYLLEPMDDTSTTLKIFSGDSYQAGGALKIGDEFIGYTDDEDNCHRGLLGTTAITHDAGDRGFNMSFIPMTFLAGGVDDSASEIPIGSSQGFMSEGFALVGDQNSGYEVFGYCGKGDQSLYMPADLGKRGLFRGAFGTGRMSHADHVMVYGIPFRYADCVSDFPAFDHRMGYVILSMEVPNATWRSVGWDEVIPNELPLDVGVVVRVDGAPGWQSTPTNSPGGLYLFDEPTAGNELNIEGDTIEVMVGFAYDSGAYDAMNWFTTHGWKFTPAVGALRIEYERPIIVRSHEED